MKIYDNSIPDLKKKISLWWLYQLFCLKFVKCSSLRCVFIILVDVLGYTNTANTDLVLFCFILILKWEKQLVLEYIFHCVYRSLFKNSHFSREASFRHEKNKEIITRKFDFCPTPKKKLLFFQGRTQPSKLLFKYKILVHVIVATSKSSNLHWEKYCFSHYSACQNSTKVYCSYSRKWRQLAVWTQSNQC